MAVHQSDLTSHEGRGKIARLNRPYWKMLKRLPPIVDNQERKCKSNSNVATNTCLASIDHNVEAFSGNPTDGSFAVLALQLATYTKYRKEVFLS